METSKKQSEEETLFTGAKPKEELHKSTRRDAFKHRHLAQQTITAPGEKENERAELRGSLIIQRRAEEHYSNGKAAMEKFQYEKAVACFSRAITLQPEQTRLHVNQAEAFLRLCDFQSAAVCYNRARLLEPGAFSDRLAFIYYLQGQCLFERGLFLEALEAFGRAAEVKPGCRVCEVKSLACLSAAGHHAVCLQKVNEWIISDSPTSDLYVLKARLHQLLKQTPQCFKNVKAALALNPSCPQAGALLKQLREASEWARQKAVERSLSGQLPGALCMINMALESSPEDSRLYLFRGILYRLLKDFTAAIEDLVQAVEFIEEEEEEEEGEEGEEGEDGEEGEEGEEMREVKEEDEDHGPLQAEVRFQLVLTYNDFAVHCFSRGLYAEATLLLNKAISEEKSQACLYLNRGDCFFKQGEWSFALADYHQAEEMMQPHDPAVWLRLAVVYNTLGSSCLDDGRLQEAVEMFTLAIQYNPAASRCYENRAKAFRKLQNFEPAKKDLICLLILDPTNEELPPMMMNVFPGRSESDVLSSPAAEAVKAQLMEAIEACSSPSDQQSLTEKLQKMNLTDKKPESQSEEPSGAEGELKLCVNEQGMEIFVKSLLQVGEVASSSSS